MVEWVGGRVGARNEVTRIAATSQGGLVVVVGRVVGNPSKDYWQCLTEGSSRSDFPSQKDVFGKTGGRVRDEVSVYYREGTEGLFTVELNFRENSISNHSLSHTVL